MAMTEDDVQELILDRIDSGEWWVVVDVGNSVLPRIIQERHYPSGEEFQLVLGPELAYETLSFFVMRKERMTAAELAACVADAGGEALPPAVYEQRSFLFSPRRQAPAVLVEAFYAWLAHGRRSRSLRAANL